MIFVPGTRNSRLERANHLLTRFQISGQVLDTGIFVVESIHASPSITPNDTLVMHDNHSFVSLDGSKLRGVRNLHPLNFRAVVQHL